MAAVEDQCGNPVRVKGFESFEAISWEAALNSSTPRAFLLGFRVQGLGFRV